jgi:hypothetical protein
MTALVICCVAAAVRGAGHGGGGIKPTKIAPHATHTAHAGHAGAGAGASAGAGGVTGFATSEPSSAATSQSLQSSPRAIARWDAVPYQTIAGKFVVGVVAFHIDGIDRVEFTVNGGVPQIIRSMTRNEQTGVVEYCLPINADAFAGDSSVELRATAFPISGTPRALEPLPLYVAPADDRAMFAADRVRYVAPSPAPSTQATFETAEISGRDGSIQQPVTSIRRAVEALDAVGGDRHADDATVYLLPGDYALGLESQGTVAKTAHGFLTIAAAPGVPREHVRITAARRVDTRLLHVRDVTLQGVTISAKPDELEPVLWLEHCTLAGDNKYDDVAFARRKEWIGGVYLTDCDVQNVANGVGGARLQRNVTVHDVLSDAFQNCPMVVNCSVDGIDKGKSDAHPDIAQWNVVHDLDNVIYYGLRATNARAQGIFMKGAGRVSNVAYVDVSMDLDPTAYASQWWCPADHVLMWRVHLRGQRFLLRTNQLSNLSIRESGFAELVGLDQLPPGAVRESDVSVLTRVR